MSNYRALSHRQVHLVLTGVRLQGKRPVTTAESQFAFLAQFQGSSSSI
jgi:hypothetical protein